MRPAVLLAALVLLLAAPLRAQETRVAPEGHVPPAATITQMDWLVGQWTGVGIGGAPAQEDWLPATGTTMVGTFVQQDSAGGIRFTEHMYLMEEGGSLVLRLKHFNADLTGWEEKDGMLTFRLIAIEECAAFFHALTLRCDPRAAGEDGILAAVRMQSAGDEVQELVFRFGRLSPGTTAAGCPDAITTLDTNECLARILERADTRRAHFLEAALEQEAGNDALIAAIGDSERAFEAYREAECGAVYEDWKDGTIRVAMALDCRIALTDRRTQDIWRNWLTYMDSTPPMLPEGAATR